MGICIGQVDHGVCETEQGQLAIFFCSMGVCSRDLPTIITRTVKTGKKATANLFLSSQTSLLVVIAEEQLSTRPSLPSRFLHGTCFLEQGHQLALLVQGDHSRPIVAPTIAHALDKLCAMGCVQWCVCNGVCTCAMVCVHEQESAQAFAWGWPCSSRQHL